jgi:hypothetical protein
MLEIVNNTGATFTTAANYAVTISDTVSATVANTIVNDTTGIVTATVSSDTAANLNSALVNASSTDALTITVNNTSTAASDLNGLDTKTSVAVGATAITELTGDATAVKTALASSGITTVTNYSLAVNVSGSTSVADINTINSDSATGIVTATVTSGAASVLKSLTTTSTDAITMTVNAEVSGATAAADLVSLNGNTNKAITMTAVTSVSGSYADLYNVYVTNAGEYTGEGDEAVAITGSVTANEADAIADVTSGIVTATITENTAAALNTALVDSGSQVNAYDLTISAGSAAAIDLTSLDGKTSLAVKAANVTAITGSATEVAAAYAANTAGTITGLGNETVSITGTTVATLAELKAINNATSGTITLNAQSISADYSGSVSDVKAAFNGITTQTGKITLTDSSVSVADINTVATVTSGEVTATVTSGAASVLKSLTTTSTDAITMTVNAEVSGATAAADLVSLNGNTNKAITMTAVTSVSGSYADLYNVYVTNAGEYTGEGDEAVAITGSVTANEADAIADVTSGIVTATITENTAAALNTALVDSGSQVNAYSLTITDAILSSTDLNSLDLKTSGTITLSNATTINVANGETLNLNNFTVSNPVTINDSAGNENITGTSNSDTLNLNGGNDTVNLGEGSDTVNVNIGNIDANDNITDTGTSGIDTLNVNGAGTIDSAALIDVNGFETLNLGSSDNTITFDDSTEFNAFRNEFTDIVDAGGNDTLSFASSAVTGNLDFSKLTEFENLNLSSVDDNITLSGDEPENVNGLAGNDTFSLDFSNVSNFTIDGGANDDTVNITGTSSSISSDTNIFAAGAFDNIETLDLTAVNLTVGSDTSDGGTSAEYQLTGSLINSWTSSNSLKLTLDADSASKLEFTNSTGTKYGGDDSNTTSITNGTYTLDSGAELIVNGL